jgi:hypothetical protein
MKTSVLPGFEPLAMQWANDCGPTAMLQVVGHLGLRIEHAELVHLWGFREGADRFDTPGHHLRVLGALGIPAAVRRRLGRGGLLRALGAGKPVVLLVPMAPFRWHWVVVCGALTEGAVVSDGRGRLVLVGWEALDGLGRRRPEGRALRVDGLGYVVGRPFPFEPDRALALDLVRLAALAEALGPVEGALAAARALARKMGWKGRRPRGNLCYSAKQPAT